VKAKACCLRQFLKDCIALGCTGIRGLNAAHVTRACLRVKDKDSWAVIRAFLKFLAVMGTVETDLSTLVPHHKQPFKVPVTYSVEEISKIENIIDRSTDIGKRDYAMLLLATRLGLRSCDIVNITLDDLDFANDRLDLVQWKTGESLVLPLLPEIQEALEDYISNGRPKTLERSVFIRQNAPYQHITTSVLRFETSKYFREAGIQITGKKHGPHTFRSSLASSMVNDAIPYEAVSKILGHSDPDAIKHYANLDIEILRQCAIEVPEPSGNFKEFLQGGGSI
jgi:site-specific recombinase XerD